MKKHWTALILALVMALALGANAVSADDAAEAAAEAPEAAVSAAEATAAEAAKEPEEAPEAPAEPDAAGTLSFANLESRIRENNYTLLALDLQLENIDKTDLEKARKDLVEGMNMIALQQKELLMPEVTASGLAGQIQSMMGTMAAQSMESTYSGLRKQLDDLQNGKTARDLESARRQLSTGEDQLVMGVESAYIQLKGYEAQEEALTRGLAALDRGLRAARISAGNGLVSELTLAQVEAQRAQLVSTQKTLRMVIETLQMNLQAAVGAELDAPLTFAALPKVTEKQLAAMDLETDLARARAINSGLLDAQATLAEARQTYDDSDRASADLRTWKAAQYMYEAAEQSFELNFRTLYAQVRDYAQKVDAAKSALSLEEKNYAASSLKCRQGTISESALADAADALADAKDAVSGAERDLLSTYRSYYWAVERGILN